MARKAWRRTGQTALAVAALAVIVAGCSRRGESVGTRVLSLLRAEVLADEPVAAPQPTREELNQIPHATIGFSYGEQPFVYMIPLAKNGDYLTYQDATERGIVMLGGAVAGTLGLGEDLQTVTFSQDDPIAHQMPLADWPRTLVRVYRYRVRDLDEYLVTVTCELEPEERVVYEIVEIRYNVTRVKEHCGNAARRFENTYWANDDGFIWASDQWLGPKLADGTVEVVRPFGGS